MFRGYAAEEARGIVGEVERAIQEDLVFLLDLVTGMGQVEREVAVIGQDEQSLAIAVQAADVEEAGPLAGEKLKDGAAIVRIRCGAEVAARLVKEDVEVLVGLDALAAHFDEIGIGDLGGEILTDVSVDRHGAIADEALATAPGTETGGSEETIDAH
jgi:hypothetical protein